MAEKKEEAIRQIATKREFVYTKNGTNLSFTLFPDNKDQMQSFLELLKLAAEDVEASLMN